MKQTRLIRKPNGLIPRSWRALVGIGAIAVLSFILGGLIVGRGGTPATSERDGIGMPAAEQLWTCSMHPQIKLPKPGKCPICFMDLIPLRSGSDVELGPRQLRLSETARKLAQIETSPAIRAFAAAEIRMVGKLAYDETKLAYITAWVPGRLDRLFADYTGVTVKRGDHLVRMYSPELLAAQEELLQAKVAVSTLHNTTSAVLRSTAQATLEAAREKLRLWGLTPRQIEELEKKQKASEELTIYAPIGGVVVHKDATEGMYVSTGTRIYTIADLSRLWVLFEAYESDLPWLGYGQHVEFTSPSFPGERFEAIISFIDPLVDPKTRTVKVRAIVDNPERRLKPDMFVSGVVESRIDSEGHIIDVNLADKWISPMHPEVVKSAPGKCDVCGMDLVPASSLGYVSEDKDRGIAPLLIPVTSPLITGKRAVVYVEIPNDDGPLFEGREVELGPRAGSYYVVKSGIVEGEMVVSNGAFKIDSELQILAKPSMMSPAGKGALGAHSHGDAPSHTADAVSRDGDARRMSRIEEPGAVLDALAPVYNAYFDIQMALARDDHSAAVRASSTISAAAGSITGSMFSPAGRQRWTSLSEQLTRHARDLTDSKSLEQARDSFFYLSEGIIALHGSFGHAGAHPYYLTFCPMARGGDGAYWLQSVDVVWNSFYGESMQRCGSI